MGTRWKKLTPSFFLIFSGTRQIFLEENKVFLKDSICDVLMIESLLVVDPTQNYGENIKKTIQGPRFHRFCYKNPLKIEKKFSKCVVAVSVQNHNDKR